MAITDPESTTFYSEWNIDKLIARGQASVAVPAYPAASVQVADLSSFGFTKVPKIVGLVSFDGGVNWNPSGGGLYTFGSPVILTSTLTSLNAVSDSGASNVIVKYWIFNSTVTA